MNRKHSLPPLDGLIHLDAVHRHQSMSAAARELGLSQVAVSKRIRQLEDWLGQPLIRRAGRGIVTTAAAAHLAGRAAISFDFLQQAVSDLRQHPGAAPVRLACMSALATFWLQPRLRRFALSADPCPVDLILTDEPARLFAPENDLVLTYGDGRFGPSWVAQALMPETLLPVLAPSCPLRDFATDSDGDSDIEGDSAVPLLDFPREGPDWIDWGRWAALAGLDLSARPRRLCATYAHSIGLALRGEGVALGSLPLMQAEIDNGRLRALPAHAVTTARGYHLLARTTPRPDAQAGRLQRFLLQG